MSLLIALQSVSGLIFAGVFVCTYGYWFDSEEDLKYGTNPNIRFGLWSEWSALFSFLASAQAAVDLLWIYVYTDAYYEKQG
jgi:hypothetical protein